MVKGEASVAGKKNLSRALGETSPHSRAAGKSAPKQDAPAFAKWVRGADADKRAMILDCADRVFLETGFQAASMSEIAARVGGSKGTLYNYFPSKEDLFLACVARHCDTFRGQMSSLIVEGADVRETLTKLGRRFVEFVSSDETVRKFRMIVAEAERSPAIARAFYETGPARGAGVLAAYLEAAMARGALAKGDPLRAAHQFLNLCQNRLFKARLCNAEPAPSRAAVEEDVAEALRVFMAAYAPSAQR